MTTPIADPTGIADCTTWIDADHIEYTGAFSELVALDRTGLGNKWSGGDNIGGSGQVQILPAELNAHAVFDFPLTQDFPRFLLWQSFLPGEQPEPHYLLDLVSTTGWTIFALVKIRTVTFGSGTEIFFWDNAFFGVGTSAIEISFTDSGIVHWVYGDHGMEATCDYLTASEECFYTLEKPYTLDTWDVITVWSDGTQIMLYTKLSPEPLTRNVGGFLPFDLAPENGVYFGGGNERTDMASGTFITYNRPLDICERWAVEDWINREYGLALVADPCPALGGRRRMFTTAVGIH